MAVVTTPLGFQKPDGNELVKNGDNVIATNAQKAQDLHAKARADIANLQAAAGFDGDPLVMQDAVVAELVSGGLETSAAIDANSASLIADPATLTGAALNAAIETSRIAPDNSARAVGKGEIVVNVRDHGAVGDGVTDETVAFQAAMDAAGGTFGQGGKLLIPAGDYWPKSPVILRNNVKIEGQGWPIIRRKFGDPSYAIFAALSQGQRGYGSGASRWECTGIEFRATFKAGAERSGCAFALHHAQGVKIYKNRFVEMQITGHVMDLNGCDRIDIYENDFLGILDQAGSKVSETIQIDQSKNGSLSHADAAGSYDGLLSRNITIRNNNFLPYTDADGVWHPAGNLGGSHTTRQGVYYENIHYIDNYILDPIQGAASSNNLRGNLHLQGMKNVIIRGNKWVSTKGGNGCMVSVLTVDAGNALDNDPEVVTPVSAIPPQGCIDVTIEGNTFQGFSGTSSSHPLIRVEGLLADKYATSGVFVETNKFADNFLATSGSDPIDFKYAANVTVAGNKYIGMNTRMIRLFGCNDITATTNISGYSSIQPIWAEGCVRVTIGLNKWKNASNVSRVKDSSEISVYGNSSSQTQALAGFVLEGCTGFNVGANNFLISVASASAVILSGSGNTNGSIANNACFGYTAAVTGTGTNVTIGTNPK